MVFYRIEKSGVKSILAVQEIKWWRMGITIVREIFSCIKIENSSKNYGLPIVINRNGINIE